MNRALIVGLLVIYGLSLYPAVLAETQRTGQDAPTYWKAGKGIFERVETKRGTTQDGWVYSRRLAPVFGSASDLPYPWFLAIVHMGNVIGMAALMLAALRRASRWPVLGWTCVFIIGAKASDILANGNITGMLCGASLNPVGAILACCFKPHFAVAVVLHAAAWCVSQRRSV